MVFFKWNKPCKTSIMTVDTSHKLEYNKDKSE